MLRMIPLNLSLLRQIRPLHSPRIQMILSSVLTHLVPMHKPLFLRVHIIALCLLSQPSLLVVQVHPFPLSLLPQSSLLIVQISSFALSLLPQSSLLIVQIDPLALRLLPKSLLLEVRVLVDFGGKRIIFDPAFALQSLQFLAVVGLLEA